MAEGIRIEVDEARINDFCRRHHIQKMWFFGSVLRKDFRPDSDVDVLVEFDPRAQLSFWDVIGVQEELADLLGRPVDLVERSAVERSKNYIRRRHILRSIEPVYVAR